MNQRGNVFLGFTIGLVLFIFGVLVLNFFLDDITQARSDLQCSNPSSITSGTMVVCLLHDAVVPYWIWLFCSVFIGYIMGRNT